MAGPYHRQTDGVDRGHNSVLTGRRSRRGTSSCWSVGNRTFESDVTGLRIVRECHRKRSTGRGVQAKPVVSGIFRGPSNTIGGCAIRADAPSSRRCLGERLM